MGHLDRYAIVDGTIADLDPALDLDIRAHRARDARYGPPAGAHDSIAERLGAPGTIFLLAIAGDAIVGTAIAAVARMDDGSGTRIEDVAHVSFVAVDPQWWGCGIARALMVAIEERVRTAGFARVQLWAREHDLRSFTLYHHLGYRPTGESKTDSGCGDVIIRMAKAL